VHVRQRQPDSGLSGPAAGVHVNGASAPAASPGTAAATHRIAAAASAGACALAVAADVQPAGSGLAGTRDGPHSTSAAVFGYRSGSAADDSGMLVHERSG